MAGVMGTRVDRDWRKPYVARYTDAPGGDPHYAKVLISVRIRYWHPRLWRWTQTINSHWR